MLTGRDDHKAILDALSAGADDFVTKTGELTGAEGAPARPAAQEALRGTRTAGCASSSCAGRWRRRRRAPTGASSRARSGSASSSEGVQDYAIFMLDPAGRIASWNPAPSASTATAPTRSSVATRSVLFPPEDVELGRPAAELESTVETGRSIQEGYRVRKDGTRYWANEVISVLFDEAGQPRGFAKVTRDVTERRRVHEAQRILVSAGQILGESLDFEETLRRVVRVALPDFASICVLLLQDESGAIDRQVTAHADPSMAMATELPGRITADSAGRGIGRVLRTAQPELIPKVTDSFVRAISFDQAHYEALRSLSLASHLTVPLTARGRTLGTLSFASTHRRYDARSISRPRAGSRAARGARRRQRPALPGGAARGARATILSRSPRTSYRTPLTPMQLQVDGLLRAGKRGGLTAERATPRLEMIKRQVERLARLITNLLDISRISAGRLQIELEDVDLAAHGERGAGAVPRGALCAAGCPVNLSAPASIVGRWDRLRLDQIVTNLLSNAVKYGAGKPIDVTLEDPRGPRPPDGAGSRHRHRPGAAGPHLRALRARRLQRELQRLRHGAVDRAADRRRARGDDPGRQPAGRGGDLHRRPAERACLTSSTPRAARLERPPHPAALLDHVLGDLLPALGALHQRPHVVAALPARAVEERVGRLLGGDEPVVSSRELHHGGARAEPAHRGQHPAHDLRGRPPRRTRRARRRRTGRACRTPCAACTGS